MTGKQNNRYTWKSYEDCIEYIRSGKAGKSLLVQELDEQVQEARKNILVKMNEAIAEAVQTAPH